VKYIVNDLDINHLRRLPTPCTFIMNIVPASAVDRDAQPWFDDDADLNAYGLSLNRDFGAENKSRGDAVKVQQDRLSADHLANMKVQKPSELDKAHQAAQVEAQVKALDVISLRPGDVLFVGLYDRDARPAARDTKAAVIIDAAGKKVAVDAAGKELPGDPKAPVDPRYQYDAAGRRLPVVTWLQFSVGG
jgi:hypothetical protein